MQPTNSELDILRIIWDRQEATVRDVHETLNEGADKETGYTTTLKLMQIMHEKGLLARRKEGKTHIYVASQEAQAAKNSLLDRLIDTAFQGSALNMVVQALGHRPASREELDAIRSFLDEMEARQDSAL